MVKDVQFVVNAKGERTGVFLSLQDYEAFEEYMMDQGLARAARIALADEERIPWEQVKAELTAEGKLDA